MVKRHHTASQRTLILACWKPLGQVPLLAALTTDTGFRCTVGAWPHRALLNPGLAILSPGHSVLVFKEDRMLATA
jgi:hypothetical protein